MKDPFKGIEFPSEKEINEETRRAKISSTTKEKMLVDPDFAKKKRDIAKTMIEAKRKISVEDRLNIMQEYWNSDQIRPLHFAKTIGKRYNCKTSVIEHIYMNYHNTLSDTEYSALVEAYETKYNRSDMMKQVHASGSRDNVKAGKNISLAKNGLTPDQSIEIYERCLDINNSNCRTQKFYKQLSKEYGGVSWSKIRDTANGHHPALESRDVEADVSNWKKYSEGYYRITSPQNVVYEFETLHEVGKFICLQQELPVPEDTATQWAKGRQKFEHIPLPGKIVGKRKFWKDWVFERYVPVNN